MRELFDAYIELNKEKIEGVVHGLLNERKKQATIRKIIRKGFAGRMKFPKDKKLLEGLKVGEEKKEKFF
jgi:hypothetical protein